MFGMFLVSDERGPVVEFRTEHQIKRMVGVRDIDTNFRLSIFVINRCSREFSSSVEDPASFRYRTKIALQPG